MEDDTPAVLMRCGQQRGEPVAGGSARGCVAHQRAAAEEQSGRAGPSVLPGAVADLDSRDIRDCVVRAYRSNSRRRGEPQNQRCSRGDEPSPGRPPHSFLPRTVSRTDGNHVSLQRRSNGTHVRHLRHRKEGFALSLLHPGFGIQYPSLMRQGQPVCDDSDVHAIAYR